jgi:1-phosphofructokinase family hexose kinase
MRTNRVVTCVGGKGLDSSVVLACLGVETIGLGMFAGKTGQELLEVVQAYGIQPEAVWVGGETRVAHVIVETRHNRHSHIIAGEVQVAPEHVKECLKRFRQQVRGASYVICAGSIPAGARQDLYGRMVAEASAFNVPVLIDSARAPIIEAIPYRPAALKMNWEEFEWTFGVKAASLDELVRLGGQVYHERGLNALVLTCGAEGILAFSSEGAYHAIAPRQESVNAAGSGDAVSSALAWRFSQGDGWPAALQWAGAVSAAAVLTEATAECSWDDIRRIYPDVKVSPL